VPETQSLARSLVSPIRLEVRRKPDRKDCVQVVIETVRGSRNKMAYDEELGAFRLKKVLPEGMTFPYDFGFVPSTLADDGDPLDALVLMDEPATMGCVVSCRVIGVMLGEQSDGKKKCRNDRLIAVALPSHTHSDLHRIDDLNETLLEELAKFFVNYHAVNDEEFRVLGCKGPGKARKLIEEAAHRWRKKDKKETKRASKKERATA